MPILAAHFSLDIPKECFARWPENKMPPFQFIEGDFVVEVTFVFNEIASDDKEEKFDKIRFVVRIDICIKRDEALPPPVLIKTKTGGRDLSTLTNYLEDKRNDFAKVAIEYYNRVILFFRYELRTPALEEIDLHNKSIQSPDWSDGNGNFLPAIKIFLRPPIIRPNLAGIDVDQFSPETLPNFNCFMNKPTQHILAYDILSDAHSTLIEGNLRRSVIELAIASEIIAKRAFFTREILAGAAFDYLEKISRPLSIAELVDKACADAFSRSFKTDHRSSYDNICHLFECRNSVVHSGELIYKIKDKDNKGKHTKVEANKVTITYWFNSVINMKNWLNTILNEFCHVEHI